MTPRETIKSYIAKIEAHDVNLSALSNQMLRKFDEFQNLVAKTEARIRANAELTRVMDERLDSTDGLILKIYHAFMAAGEAEERANKRKRTRAGRRHKSRRRK